MDEPNATRVSAPPAEVAKRGGHTYPPKAYLVSIRLTSTESGKFLTGLLAELLKTRGFAPDSVITQLDTPPLAAYHRKGATQQ